jgi:integrase
MQIKNVVLLTDATNINYIDYTHKRFIFNTYKTAKFTGQTIEDIPNKLFECINMYIALHPILKGNTDNMNTRFLVAFNGRPLTISNDMTRILNDIFNKNIGVTMLRHVFITHKFGDLKREREDIANKMGHSTDMQDIYIKK